MISLNTQRTRQPSAPQQCLHLCVLVLFLEKQRIQNCPQSDSSPMGLQSQRTANEKESGFDSSSANHAPANLTINVGNGRRQGTTARTTVQRWVCCGKTGVAPPGRLTRGVFPHPRQKKVGLAAAKLGANTRAVDTARSQRNATVRFGGKGGPLGRCKGIRRPGRRRS